jgi:hypothetical protein
VKAAARLVVVSALALAALSAVASAAQPGPLVTAHTFAQKLFVDRNLPAARRLLGGNALSYVGTFWRTTWGPNGDYRNLVQVVGTSECSGKTTVTMTAKSNCIRFHVVAYRTDRRKLVEETKATLLVTTAETAAAPWRVVEVDYRAAQEVICTAAEFAKHARKCRSSLPFPR